MTALQGEPESAPHSIGHPQSALPGRSRRYRSSEETAYGSAQALFCDPVCRRRLVDRRCASPNSRSAAGRRQAQSQALEATPEPLWAPAPHSRGPVDSARPGGQRRMGEQRAGSRSVAGGGTDGGDVTASRSGRTPEKSREKTCSGAPARAGQRSKSVLSPRAALRPGRLSSARDGMREALTAYESDVRSGHHRSLAMTQTMTREERPCAFP